MTNLHIYRFNFSDALFHRSRLCRGSNSEKVKLALSLEILWNSLMKFLLPIDIDKI